MNFLVPGLKRSGPQSTDFSSRNVLPGLIGIWEVLVVRLSQRIFFFLAVACTCF